MDAITECFSITGYDRSNSTTDRSHGVNFPSNDLSPWSQSVRSRNIYHQAKEKCILHQGTEDSHLSRLVLSSWNFGFSFNVIPSWKCPHKLGIEAPPTCPYNTHYFCSQDLFRLYYNCLMIVHLPLGLWTLIRGQGALACFFLLQYPNLSECLPHVRDVMSICGMKGWMNNWRSRTVP